MEGEQETDLFTSTSEEPSDSSNEFQPHEWSARSNRVSASKPARRRTLSSKSNVVRSSNTRDLGSQNLHSKEHLGRTVSQIPQRGLLTADVDRKTNLQGNPQVNATLENPQSLNVVRPSSNLLQSHVTSQLAPNPTADENFGYSRFSPPPLDYQRPPELPFDPAIRAYLDRLTDADYNVPADNIERFCFCQGTDDGRPMIECDNANCLYSWYHMECIGMSPEKVPEKWLCSRCYNRLSLNADGSRADSFPKGSDGSGSAARDFNHSTHSHNTSASKAPEAVAEMGSPANEHAEAGAQTTNSYVSIESPSRRQSLSSSLTTMQSSRTISVNTGQNRMSFESSNSPLETPVTASLTPRKRNPPRKDVPHSRAKRRRHLSNLKIQTKFRNADPGASSDAALPSPTSARKSRTRNTQDHPVSAFDTTNTSILLGPRSAGIYRPWTAPFEKSIDTDALGSRVYTVDEMTALKNVLSKIELCSPKHEHEHTYAPRSSSPVTPSKKSSDTFSSSLLVSTPTKKKHGGTGKPRGTPYTEKEAALLKSVMEEFTADGKHVGDSQWEQIQERMKSLGVDRPVHGLRMAWSRRFRSRFGIDERYNKDSTNLNTSLLTPRKKTRANVRKGGESTEDEWEDDNGEHPDMRSDSP